MTGSKNWLGDRERALEDEYFWRKDRELIERLRDKGRLEDERRLMHEQLGDVEEQVLTDLQTEGFAPENLGLLHLIPLVEVAWAEGEVTPRERELVLALAARRGIGENSPAYRQLTEWLERRPDDHFFDTAYEAIRGMLSKQDAAEREKTEHDLLEWATKIAEATGGILGMAPVCRDERECIERIAASITDTQRAVASERGARVSR